MEWEAIVNQHAKANKDTAMNKHIKKYSKRVLVSSVVAIFFLLATALKLVEPVLGIPVMVISLWGAAWAVREMFRTDDPLRDFDRYDAAMAALEAKLPHCDKCGEAINDDEYFYINDEVLCEECMRNEYARSTQDYLDDNY